LSFVRSVTNTTATTPLSFLHFAGNFAHLVR